MRSGRSVPHLDHGIHRHQRHSEIGRMGSRRRNRCRRRSRACGCRRAKRCSRCRARACCTASPDRENSRIGCAAGGCRRSTPHCEPAATRWPAEPLRSAGNAWRTAGSSATSLMRASAPRRKRSGVTSISVQGRALMSIRCWGAAAPSFISCIRSVPPAMNAACSSSDACPTAPPASCAWMYSKGCITRGSRSATERTAATMFA